MPKSLFDLFKGGFAEVFLRCLQRLRPPMKGAADNAGEPPPEENRSPPEVAAPPELGCLTG